VSQVKPSDSTRPSLLVRLRKSGDTEAWNLFVEVYGPLIYGRCRRHGLKHEDAEDVSQKTFSKIAKAMMKFEYQPARGRFRHWLGCVVNGEINRFLRKAGNIPEETGDYATLDNLESRPEDSAWTEEFNSRVMQMALARCRPHFEDATWQAFELIWLENCSVSDVAWKMKQSMAWVYLAKSRALKRLWQEVVELTEMDGFLSLHDEQQENHEN
jgi:RNA polymerase sigma factor (sigma-70 family)